MLFFKDKLNAFIIFTIAVLIVLKFSYCYQQVVKAGVHEEYKEAAKMELLNNFRKTDKCLKEDLTLNKCLKKLERVEANILKLEQLSADGNDSYKPLKQELTAYTLAYKYLLNKKIQLIQEVTNSDKPKHIAEFSLHNAKSADITLDCRIDDYNCKNTQTNVLLLEKYEQQLQKLISIYQQKTVKLEEISN